MADSNPESYQQSSNWNRENKLRFCFIIRKLLLIAGIFLLLLQQVIADTLPSNGQIQNQLAEMITTVLAPSLPQEIDELTILRNVKLFGVRGLEYVYQLTKKKKYFDGLSGFYTTQKRITISLYCSNESMYWYRDNFVEMKWSYLDSENKAIFFIRANPNDC